MRRTNHVLAISIILMLISITALPAMAAAPSEESDDKGKPLQTKPSSGMAQISSATEGNQYVQMAWIKYGPISVASGGSSYFRVYYPGVFTGSLTPVVTVSLEQYPWTSKYSIGMDQGYVGNGYTDVRINSISGALSSSYIHLHAMK